MDFSVHQRNCAQVRKPQRAAWLGICRWAGLVGIIFAMQPLPGALAGVGFTNVVSFAGTNGAIAIGSLMRGADGAFYGMTYGGGTYGQGTVFRLTADGALTTVASLDGTNGAPGHAGLVQGPDGSLYSTTPDGGAYNQGAVFQVTPEGQLRALVSFNQTNGAMPSAELTFGPDGNLYGTAVMGGPYTNNFGTTLGTVFRLTLDGSFTNLVFFDGTNGGGPSAPLVVGRDGNFYGTTLYGGTFGAGTLFRMTLTGALTTVASLDGTNGAGSMFGLVEGSDGSWYGTGEGGAYTDFPGGNRLGNVFKVSPDGVVTSLFSFSGTNGCVPRGLHLAQDGNFYGVGGLGGIGYTGFLTSGQGTIFKITPTGEMTTLLMFADGGAPFCALVEGADGCLYGTTREGGVYGNGSVFRLTVPMAPSIRSVAVLGNTLTLSWNAVAGLSYQVQYRSGPGSGGWTNLGPPVTATNGMASGWDLIGSDSQRFYRLSLPGGGL